MEGAGGSRRREEAEKAENEVGMEGGVGQALSGMRLAQMSRSLFPSTVSV